jgi:hypothetical protein
VAFENNEICRHSETSVFDTRPSPIETKDKATHRLSQRFIHFIFYSRRPGLAAKATLDHTQPDLCKRAPRTALVRL